MIDGLAGVDLTPLVTGVRPVDVVVRDGLLVRLDVLRPDDGPALQAGFARLSPRTRYLRFFTGAAALGAGELAYLLRLDGHHRWAVAAFDPSVPADLPGDPRGLGIGVASFTRTDDPAEAEPAVVVADRYQGRGVGTLLLAAIAVAARGRGVERFVATALAENRRLVDLARDLGAEVRVVPDDRTVVQVVMPLSDIPDRLASSALYALLRRHAAP